MEPPVFKTRGIILKKAELSDSARLLTVYTEKRGKIMVRAKGVGKRDSKLKGMIEPFNVYEFLLAQSRNIAVLANAYPGKEFIYLRGHLENLSLAIYFGELVDRFLIAPETDKNIWSLLARGMEVLDEKKTDLKKIKAVFEEKLLEFLGHPGFRIQGKITDRERSFYLNSLIGEEVISARFLNFLKL